MTAALASLPRPRAASLCRPYGIHLDAQPHRMVLAVADSDNNRVMIWQRVSEG